MIIDTHCHLDDKRYDDLDEVIERALEANVKKMIIPAADIEDLPRAKRFHTNLKISTLLVESIQIMQSSLMKK